VCTVQLGLVLALIFAIVIAVFVAQNTTPVALTFLVFHFEQVAASILILAAVLLGAVLTFALSLVREVQHRSELRVLHEQLHAYEQETAATMAKDQAAAERAPISDG
jgi:uncharacterized integral membrane protein